MKCKYCGKELRERQRFCDRCGRTVRHINEVQRRQSGTGTVPKRRPASGGNGVVHRGDDSFKRYERYRRDQQKRASMERQRKIKQRRFLLFIIILSVCVGIVAFVVAFNKTKESGIANINAPETTEFPMSTEQVPVGIPSALTEQGDVIMTEVPGESESVGSAKPTGSASPASSPKPTGSASATSSAKPSGSPSPSAGTKPNASTKPEENDKYMVYKETTTGITCPYPSDFDKSDVSSTTTKITVTDGDAQIRINTDKITTQDSAQSLLKSYSSGVGVEISDSSSAKDIYSVSFVRNGKYNHRTGVIAEGRHIYYDFSCSAESADKSAYKEIMEYADNSLKTQIEKLNSED